MILAWASPFKEFVLGFDESLPNFPWLLVNVGWLIQ